MIHDYTSDAWLSGFIDGEGCFTRCSGPKRPDGTRKYNPTFKIGLTIADRAVIDELAEQFGGSVWVRKAYGSTKESVQWTIGGRKMLAVLIEYLERFPLRAKKAEQFAAWREEHGL